LSVFPPQSSESTAAYSSLYVSKVRFLMKNYITTCSLAAAIFLAGCKHGHSVVGTWTSTSPAGTQQVTFSADNRLTAVGDIKTPPMTATVTGTYTLESDVLAIKATDLTVKAKDASLQPLIDSQMGPRKKGALDQINRSGASNKVVWKSDDEFVAADAKGTQQTFTRVKS